MNINLYDFTIEIWKFILKAFNAFNKLWNFEFDILGETISFQALATTALITLLAIHLIGKFV